MSLILTAVFSTPSLQFGSCSHGRGGNAVLSIIFPRTIGTVEPTTSLTGFFREPSATANGRRSLHIKQLGHQGFGTRKNERWPKKFLFLPSNQLHLPWVWACVLIVNVGQGTISNLSVDLIWQFSPHGKEQTWTSAKYTQNFKRAISIKTQTCVSLVVSLSPWEDLCNIKSPESYLFYFLTMPYHEGISEYRTSHFRLSWSNFEPELTMSTRGKNDCEFWPVSIYRLHGHCAVF